MAELTIEQRRAVALAQARQRAAMAQQQPPAPQPFSAGRVPAEPFQRGQFGRGAPVPPTQVTGAPESFRGAASQLGRGAVGVGELGLTALSGAASEALAGLAGIEEFIRGGDDRLERSAARIERVREAIPTFTPRTEAGQRIAGEVGNLAQGLVQGAERAGGATLEATGSPGLATAVDVGIQALPGAVGVRSVPRMMPGSQRGADIRRVTETARREGVDLGGAAVPQRQQIIEAARRQAGGERGEAGPDIQAALIRQRDQARLDRNALYEQARQTRAGIPESQVKQLPQIMRDATRDFLTEDMPRVRTLLERLDRVNDLPEGSVVHLRAIDDWRRMLNRAQPSQRDARAAISVMKGRLDNWMDTMFDRDMVLGDPAAVSKWREARRAHRSYMERFSDDRVIRNLVEMEATPAQVRQWIFGASATGAKAPAASVVRRIKDEVGENSPEFSALRHDALIDVMEPVLRPEPDLRGYVRNFDRMVGRDPTLARELFGENLQGLTDLRNLAQAHMRRPASSAAEIPGFSRIAAVGLFGHELARGALRRAVGESAFKALATVAGRGAKRRMIGEVLGYDPFQPMFRRSTPAILGGTQELAEQAPEAEAVPPNAPFPRSGP